MYSRYTVYIPYLQDRQSSGIGVPWSETLIFVDWFSFNKIFQSRNSQTPLHPINHTQPDKSCDDFEFVQVFHYNNLRLQFTAHLHLNRDNAQI